VAAEACCPVVACPPAPGPKGCPVTNLTLSDAQKARLARLRALPPSDLDHVHLLLAVMAGQQVDWALRSVEDDDERRQP